MSSPILIVPICMRIQRAIITLFSDMHFSGVAAENSKQNEVIKINCEVLRQGH